METPWDKYARDAVFVGLPDEHAAFCREVGPVTQYPTDDLLQVARVIAGAKLFVGNQSSPRAIAEGLKKPVVQEIFMHDPNCCFNRPDEWDGRDGSVHLPELGQL